MFQLMGKKIITIYAHKISLSGSMLCQGHAISILPFPDIAAHCIGGGGGGGGTV